MHLIPKPFVQAGRSAIPFELLLDPSSQDILSPEGFANCCYQMLRLKVGGGAFHAPVCSTWVFLMLDKFTILSLLVKTISATTYFEPFCEAKPTRKAPQYLKVF